MKKRVDIKQPTKSEIKEVMKQVTAYQFIIYLRFADTIARYVEITMKKSNTSRLRGALMFALLINDGSITPTQLSQYLLRSKHSLTSIVNYLEKEGLILRSYTKKDRRVTNLKLTTSGLDYLKKRISEGNKWAQEVLKSLDDNERMMLENITEKMRIRMLDIMKKHSLI